MEGTLGTDRLSLVERLSSSRRFSHKSIGEYFKCVITAYSTYLCHLDVFFFVFKHYNFNCVMECMKYMYNDSKSRGIING